RIFLLGLDPSLDLARHIDVVDIGLGADQKPTDFSYSIASLVYTGVFDPAISYLRSGNFTAKDIKVASKSDTEEVHASFAGM
ncbi:hypothetical protein ACC693_38580, partial [Rhizobium ruizarguesonis]